MKNSEAIICIISKRLATGVTLQAELIRTIDDFYEDAGFEENYNVFAVMARLEPVNACPIEVFNNTKQSGYVHVCCQGDTSC